MRNLKKVLSLALALVMLLGMMIVGAGAVDAGFKDDASIKDSYKTAAAINKALGIMVGDGTNLNPTAKITRAEAFILSLRVDGSNANAIAAKWPVSAKPFNDVGVGKWYACYLTYGKEFDLIAGNNGNFRPDEPISANDFSILLLGMMDEFKDKDYRAGYKNALRDAMAAGLYDGLDNVSPNEDITREAACQMTLNALLYSTEGEKNVYTVTDNANDDFPNFKVRTYDTAAEAYFYQQSQGKEVEVTVEGEEDEEPTVETKMVYPAVEITTTYPGSLGDKVFGLEKETGPEVKDAFQRPSTSYTAAKYGLELTIPNEATYTYAGPVSNKTLSNDVGSIAMKYGWSKVVDGVATEGSAKPGKTGTYGNTARGTVTQVYVDADNKAVEVVIVNTYSGTVAKVNAAKGDNARTVMVNGLAFENEEYEKGDVVLYTQVLGDGDEAGIKTMRLAEERTGAVTRRVNKTNTDENVYTIGGKTYQWSAMADKRVVKVDEKEAVTLWVDTQGNLVKVGADAAPQESPNHYIFVLANPTAVENPEYVTGVQNIVEVYGVTEDGVVGKHTVSHLVAASEEEPVAIQAPGSTAVDTGDGESYVFDPAEGLVYKDDLIGLYQYTTDEDTGYMILDTTSEINAYSKCDIKVNATTTTGDPKTGDILNKNTRFIFFTSDIEQGAGHDHTAKDLEVKTGIANIGTDIDKNKAYVVAEGEGTQKVVKYVFVLSKFNPGDEDKDSSTLVYVTGANSITNKTNSNTWTTIEGVTEDDEEFEAEVKGNKTNLKDTVCYVDDGGSVGSAVSNLVTGTIKSIHADNVYIDISEGLEAQNLVRLFKTDDTKFVDLTGEAEDLAVGQVVTVARVSPTNTTSRYYNDMRVVFVTGTNVPLEVEDGVVTGDVTGTAYVEENATIEGDVTGTLNVGDGENETNVVINGNVSGTVNAKAKTSVTINGAIKKGANITISDVNALTVELPTGETAQEKINIAPDAQGNTADLSRLPNDVVVQITNEKPETDYANTEDTDCDTISINYARGDLGELVLEIKDDKGVLVFKETWTDEFAASEHAIIRICMTNLQSLPSNQGANVAGTAVTGDAPTNSLKTNTHYVITVRGTSAESDPEVLSTAGFTTPSSFVRTSTGIPTE